VAVVERLEIQRKVEQEDLEEVRRVDSREQEDLEHLDRVMLEEVQTVVTHMLEAEVAVLEGLHRQPSLVERKLSLVQERFRLSLEHLLHMLEVVAGVEPQIRVGLEELRMVRQVVQVAGVLAVDILGQQLLL
jgi:hypothetical protein